MSDVTVQVIGDVTTVTVDETEVVTVEVTTDPVTVTVGEAGPQGATGPVGPLGPPGTQPAFSRSGLLEPVVGTHRYYIERANTITKVRASVGTAPVGASITIDVKKNGTSILGGTLLSVAAGQFTNTRTTSVAVSAGDYLTVDIVSVGTSTPGSDLTVTVTLE